MELKQVTIEETKLALSLLKESAEWLKEIGSEQWSEILSGQDKHGLTNAIEKGEVYFFYNNTQLAGLVAAWEMPTEWDRLLWKEINEVQKVCYIHRVIIRPIYRGKSYGAELLTALKRKFSGEVLELRLDCLASNQKLIAFYQKNGFINVGSSKDLNGNEFELFSFEMQNQS
ncbi:hypothetical protein UAY_02573 [Enterococcus moraviensis ATCC BAA-383]|uniref:N-acetyltransferase domain-containing protein n=1 Tax=Enterococcus moraviensis ATCC BAA-383 TaxID=1158609 RepID=R2QJR9_9ENTE|nr:GNAT family N-acetyltransferase [Enterococcus moraviensis]EOH96842.1 hypothetical protein UAY_02573 [Enterococcus moraviensis ATCC BAA-383]EOT71543.1 hypothetical protein I586_01345 [Enterococcus moraviensis ATCC BAA-383]OJG68590.1 hypothetical protein RV09_GL001837 [Enterococcus moraviensis]